LERHGDRQEELSVIEALNEIEVITLFVPDLERTKTFYRTVFGLPVVYQDANSAVMKFGGLMVNLLERSRAPALVTPKPIAEPGAAPSALLTIKVADADSVCKQLGEHGVALLNGPVDRPWKRRTAAFEDPAGNVWEIAQVLN
jgi:catechol 2,3-dioxygenase-like lactoylglutathione lyase family enzyme